MGYSRAILPVARVATLLSLVVGLLSAQLSGAVPARAATRVKDAPRPALVFEANEGRVGGDVAFVGRTAGGNVFFTPTGVRVVLRAPKAPSSARASGEDRPAYQRSVVHVRFLGTSSAAQLVGGAGLASRVHHLIGADTGGWRRNVATFGSVHFTSLYPGIDLVYAGEGGELKSTYVLGAGVDPAAIRWRYDGAQHVAVDGAGALRTTAGASTLTEDAPVAWQDVAGRRVPVSVAYRLGANGVAGYEVGAHDPTVPLTIDPALTFSTTLGGSAGDQGRAVAVDAAGNSYVVGYSDSLDYPTTPGAAQPANAGDGDVVVTKVDPAGAVVYSTYLGGGGDESGRGIALDPAGNVYLTGETYSDNFPRRNALRRYTAGADAFLTQLDPTGSQIVYSTFLGGSSDDLGYRIAVDATGAAYVAGRTSSSDFPVQAAYQPTFGGTMDAFVVKVAPAGAEVLFATYLGGAAEERAFDVFVDAANRVFLAGYTLSSDFPTTSNARQSTFGGGGLCPDAQGGGDAFVAELDATGAGLRYSTYLGGNVCDYGRGVRVDAAGALYLVGNTESSTFPTTEGAYRTTFRGAQDVFVAKLLVGPTATDLVYGTYIGGGDVDEARALVLDGSGEVRVVGQTQSSNFPVFPAPKPFSGQFGGGGYGGAGDAFVTRLNPAGSGLVYSAYLGGAGLDRALAAAAAPSGELVVTGETRSGDFPRATDAALRGTGDVFLVRIAENDRATPTPSPTVSASSPTPRSFSVYLPAVRLGP